MPNLPTWVKAYDGLPFEEKGRTRKGVDCWGTVCMVESERFGVELPRYDGTYKSTADIDAVAKLFNGGLSDYRPVAPKPGAIILLRMDGKPAHVGVVITAPDEREFDPGYFIHCEYGVGSCVEQYTGARWAKRTIGFFEYVPAVSEIRTAAGE